VRSGGLLLALLDLDVDGGHGIEPVWVLGEIDKTIRTPRLLLRSVSERTVWLQRNGVLLGLPDQDGCQRIPVRVGVVTEDAGATSVLRIATSTPAAARI
jgi:hypothetical protein